MSNIFGVNPPAVTIFDKNGNVDIEANKKFADFLIGKGVNGIAYLGTSGEFCSMRMEEKKSFIKEMFNYINGRVNVIVGIGDTCIDNTIELLDFVENIGVDGTLLINPYFNIYSENMVEAYVAKVAESTKLPIIIYNFPQLTGFNYSVNTVMRLAQKYKNIIGIKETVNDPEHVRHMVEIKKTVEDFKVFCAYEDQAICALINGVDGFINSTANFAPDFTVGIYKSFKEKNFEKAIEYQKLMSNATEIYNFSQPLLLAVKQAVYFRILKKEGFERLPALSLNKDTKEGIFTKLRELNLI